MLGITGGKENWPVNVGRITGIEDMRKYKPKTAVRDALKKSKFLEFTDKQHVRRRTPLAIEPEVEPESIPGKTAPAVPTSGGQSQTVTGLKKVRSNCA